MLRRIILPLALVILLPEANAQTPTSEPPPSAPPIHIRNAPDAANDLESPQTPSVKETAPALPAAARKLKEARRLKRILAIFEIEIDGQPAGIFKAQLFADKAPETVENFSALAEGRKQFKEYDEKKGKLGALTLRPFYDGLIFHRVNEHVIQGGCPLGTGRGNPGYFIKDEINKELRHQVGTLAMASSEKPDTNGSQFYITLKEIKHFDGKFSIFGRVIEGMDVVQKISKVKKDRMTDFPQQVVTMKSVKIVREYFK